MNWLALLALGGLDLVKKILFIKDPPRTDRPPVLKPPEKPK